MSEIPPIDVAPGVHVRTVVGATGSFSLGEFEGGSATPLHHHTREQADVGIAGVFDLQVGTHVETIGPGAGLIVPANVDHSIQNRRGGVVTAIEFHTVRRPDLVPPRPTVTFPASPEPVAIPNSHMLVKNPVGAIRGETCTLSMRRLQSRIAPTTIEAGDAELFIYVTSGAVDLGESGTAQHVASGTLVVVPAHGRVRATATGTSGATLVEFVPARIDASAGALPPHTQHDR